MRLPPYSTRMATLRLHTQFLDQADFILGRKCFIKTYSKHSFARDETLSCVKENVSLLQICFLSLTKHLTMLEYSMFRRKIFPVFSILFLLIAASNGVTFAQSVSPDVDLELAQMFAPALYFHPGEIFRPQPVEVLVDTARLQQERSFWFNSIVLSEVSISDLISYQQTDYALDAWYGDEGGSDYKNYTAHRRYYEASLSPSAGGLPVTAYAHILRDPETDSTTIQFWLFYYYNDWFNKHEGDWEMVQVVLDASGEPEWLILSQHHGGTRRPWETVRLEDGTHAQVFVALGSHANYFWEDEVYPNGQDVGNIRVEIMDRTGAAGRVIPEILIIPDRQEYNANPSFWSGMEWLLFGGRWGEHGLQSDFGGPLGPAEKGEQWENPYDWGLAQPLDADAWYANRLRVEVTGVAGLVSQVHLISEAAGSLPAAESLGNLAILHRDPAPGETFHAEIDVPPGVPFGVTATWPDAENSQVTHYTFDDISLGAEGKAELVLQASETPTLILPGESEPILPIQTEIESVTWDAPDLVWIGGILPVSDVVKGVALSLFAGLAPTLIYVIFFYWSDRYEKEPTRLLAAAFFWGALPALIVTIVVRIFYQLPVELLGPQAIEAVRAGLLTPVIEEALKGSVIIFLARRYRREFDNVLDGIIYGAMVGLGFAMTANTVSYLGAFFMRGFSGLGGTISVQGILFGLNHAFYSAIFGAGLGFARLARKSWQRWAVPLAAFVLAVIVHGLHNLILRSAIGIAPLAVIATWVGVIVMVVVMLWSLRRQQQIIKLELKDEIPQSLYLTLITPGARARSQWDALKGKDFSGWKKTRRLYQLCTELAFKKSQHRLQPSDIGIKEELDKLRQELQAQFDNEETE